MTQNEALMMFFRRGKSITQEIASAKLGIKRLAARIMELEEKGYLFYHKMVTVKSRHGSARIAKYILLQRPSKS